MPYQHPTAAAPNGPWDGGVSVVRCGQTTAFGTFGQNTAMCRKPAGHTDSHEDLVSRCSWTDAHHWDGRDG